LPDLGGILTEYVRIFESNDRDFTMFCDVSKETPGAVYRTIPVVRSKESVQEKEGMKKCQNKK